MENEEFKILLWRNKAYLTDKKQISLRQADIPNYIEKFDNPIYLTIRVLKYFKPERRPWYYCQN